jgi:hypothetical protein
MREMQRGNAKLKVVKHVILRNFWEYFITEMPNESGVGMAYVVGDYDEYGTFAQYDVDKHGISSTEELSELMPAPGWEWVN